MSGRKHLWIPVLSILALLNACKKQDLQPTEIKNTGTERSFGAVLETPSQLTDVPLMVSTRYMALKTRSVGPTKGKGNGGSTTSDATAPVVNITSPADGSSVTGSITVSASASDNVGVASVSLSVDGSVVSTINTAPYNFSWNSGTVPDGVHTLTAKATDAAGNWSTSSISVSKNTTVVNPPTTTIPASFSLVTPPVGYQGGEGSCVAFAVGYGARSIEEYYKSGAASYSYSSNSFSPEFLYNQTKFGDCGSGTSVTTVLDFIKNNGVCTWSSMPYSYTNGCSLMPTSSQLAEAGNYKIASYSWIYASDMTTIKSELMKNHAVIASLVPDDSFVNAGPGFIWKSYTANKTAGHVVIICGYDDAKNAYKIMNSWGTSWGDSGYSWIDYNFFPNTGSGVCYVIN
jgi:C1A family cysteine protease